MQSLSPFERASAINTLADLLISRQQQILDANEKDLNEATKNGLAKPLLSRLSLTPAKLKSLSVGLKQIAESSHHVRNLYPKILNLSEIIFFFHNLPECGSRPASHKIS